MVRDPAAREPGTTSHPSEGEHSMGHHPASARRRPTRPTMRRITIAAAAAAIAVSAGSMTAAKADSQPSLLGNAPTATTPTFFGAKLTTQSQPSNAENGQSCGENGGIPHGANCTWVAISAFENGSNCTAPRTGTIKHVKLVSCKAGKFRLQLAMALPRQG